MSLVKVYMLNDQGTWDYINIINADRVDSFRAYCISKDITVSFIPFEGSL
jgi:hypothetical protein